MNKLRTSLSFFVILLLGLMPTYGVGAQNVIATPDPETSPKGILAEFEIDSLLSPEVQVWLVRTKLEPDGRLPLGVQTGQTVLYVESGTLTLQAEGQVIAADGEQMDSTAGDILTLETGGSMMLSSNTEATAANTSADATIFLMLVMHSEMDDVQGSAQVNPATGLVQNTVSVGPAAFPPVPASVVLERVVVAPGETMQNIPVPPEASNAATSWGGIDLGRIESGSAEVIFQQASGHNVTLPPVMSASMSPPERVVLTGNETLSVGESYAAFDSVLTFTNVGDQPVTILRAVVTPQFGEQ